MVIPQRFTISLIISIISIIITLTTSQQQSCPVRSDPLRTLVPDADIFLTVLVPVHQKDQRGLLTCGEISRDGVTAVEAVRWTLSVVNQAGGTINGKRITDRLVPGVKIGAKVWDNCDYPELAVDHLVKSFPRLSSAPECWSSGIGLPNKSELTDFGVIDGAQVSMLSRVMEASINAFVPIVPMSVQAAVQSSTKGKVLTRILHDLEWTRVAIIHGSDEDSMFVVKVLGQLANAGTICLAAVEQLPSITGDDGPRKGVELRGFSRAFQSVAGKLDENVPVLVIADQPSTARLVRVMSDNGPLVGKHQWLFVSMPGPEIVSDMDPLLDGNIFTLTPYPLMMVGVEQFWSEMAGRPQPDNDWFQELVQKKACFNCTQHDAAWRTIQSLPAIHDVLTFAHAVRNAHAAVCGDRTGLCPELVAMGRHRFINDYLEPLQFVHNATLRSPQELEGARKTLDSRPGEIEHLRLSLTRLRKNGRLDPEVLVLANGDEAKIINADFNFISSPCPPDGCRHCVKVRQSRVEDPNLVPTESESSTSSSPQLPVDGIHRLSGDVQIGLLLPIHQPGPAPFECSSTVNPSAIYDYEAAVWMMAKINSVPEFVNGVKIGLTVVDTCSSNLIATQRLGRLLLSPDTAPVAFISGLDWPSAKPLAEMLKPMNVSMVSSVDISTSGALSPANGVFQSAVSAERMIQAAFEQLKMFGWKFVSIVRDDTDDGARLMPTIEKMAKEASVCLAMVGLMNEHQDKTLELIDDLRKARVAGSRTVLMLTSSKSTIDFFANYQKVSRTPGEFVFIIVRDSDLDLVHGFEERLIGSLLIRESFKPPTDFYQHFIQLSADSTRNPYFGQFQIDCAGAKCLTKAGAVNDHSAVNTMQALVSITSALARLRAETCQPESGICRKLAASGIADKMAQYIHTTASVRADDLPFRPSLTTLGSEDEMFHFGQDAASGKSLDILNFRRDPQQRQPQLYRFDKVASLIGNRLLKNPAMQYTFYDDHGHQIVPIDEVRSECLDQQLCQHCPGRSAEFLYLESRDELIVAAVVNVHEASENPLQCSRSVTNNGVQQVEALMWSLDIVNNHPQLLPGVQLGALILDTCGSHQKAARDVSNFLSNNLLVGVDESVKFPTSKSVVSFVIDGDNSKMIDSVVEVAAPLSITSVGPLARDSKYNDVDEYPMFLRMSTPNDVFADAIVSILMRFSWHYVSVVYDSSPRMIDLFTELKTKCQFLGVEFAVEEMIKNDAAYTNQMVTVVHRLKTKADVGAKVVILLLQNDQIRKLLQAGKNLADDHRLQAGQFLWVAVDAKEVFNDFPDQSIGALTIQQQVQPMSAFKNYLASIQPKNNTRNPWLGQYLETKLNCRRNGQCTGQLTVDKETTLTINSMFAIASGLELVRRKLCPDTGRGVCTAMKMHPKLSTLVFDQMKKSAFLGGDGRQVTFDPDGGFAVNSLSIYNLRHFTKTQAGITSLAWLTVGRFSSSEGLTVNLTKARGYTESGDDIPLTDVRSACSDSRSCQQTTVPTSAGQQPSMTVAPTGAFSIGAVMPIHHRPQGDGHKDPLGCGEVDPDSFQNLAAFAYALGSVRANKSLLPDVQLGSIVLDDCGSQERAQERLLHFLANDNPTPGHHKVDPKSVIAMVTYSTETGQQLSDILSAHKITHLTGSPVEDQTNPSLAVRWSPMKRHEIAALIDVIVEQRWKLVNLIYSDEDERNVFVRQAAAKKICVEHLIAVGQDMPLVAVKSQLQVLNQDKSEANVVVVLGDKKTNDLILKSANQFMLKKLIWLGGQSWLSSLNSTSLPSTNPNSLPVNSIVVQTESHQDEHFLTFMSSLNPHHHQPIPTIWMHQFWQRHFQCQLIHSPAADDRYSRPCTGEERLSPTDIYQTSTAHQTVHLVKSIAEGLHNYLTKNCLPPSQLTDIDDCGDAARTDLKKYIDEAVKTLSITDQDKFGFHILKRVDGKPFKGIGLWKEGNLLMDHEEPFEVRSSCGQENKKCRDKCKNQLSELNSSANDLSHGLLQTSSSVPSLIPINIRRTSGVVAAIVSAVGVVFVLICAFYFLMVFPVAVGTTVLGYQILLGLLLAFAVNFGFLLPATFAICWIRRLTLPLAWSLILSGMLVKVMNTWRLMAAKNSGLRTTIRLTSPSALLTISLTFVVIQIIFTTIWLLNVPPNPGLHQGSWKCSSSTSLVIFDSEVIISLLYAVSLLLITTVFSTITWKCFDQNREPRWILICCLTVATVWSGWFLSTIPTPAGDHSMSVAYANLLSAGFIMLALYARKLYIFSRLARQSRIEQKMKSRLHPNEGFAAHHHVYGTLKSPPIIWDGSEVRQNGQRNGNGLRSATRAPFEADCDDNVSSCGSVKSSGSAQVQGHDLYPMDVYDGGSQFAPMSSLFSHSNKSVYGMVDDTSFR